MSRIIYATPDHPFYKQLSILEGFSKEFPKSCDSLLMDFSTLGTNQKRELFKNYKGPIISDLSLCHGEKLISEFENISIAIATVFPSPKKTYEVFYKNNNLNEELENLFKELEIKKLEVSSPGLGFIFPRTLVQIINEAWFALEDNLASKEAIDTAMLYGVNYPLGPINWGDQGGLQNVALLLEELFIYTNQSRYRVCEKLKKAI